MKIIKPKILFQRSMIQVRDNFSWKRPREVNEKANKKDVKDAEKAKKE